MFFAVDVTGLGIPIMTLSPRQTTYSYKGSFTPVNSDITGCIHKGQFLASTRIVTLYVYFLTCFMLLIFFCSVSHDT